MLGDEHLATPCRDCDTAWFASIALSFDLAQDLPIEGCRQRDGLL